MFYVYELIDPRTSTVFYVGKGSGDRIKEHVKDARRGEHGKKCDLIREILGEGLEVIEKIVREFLDEDKAFAYEKKRIKKYGLKNLTNVASGWRNAKSDVVEARKEARQLVKSMSRAIRVLSSNDEVGVMFCGRWRDIPRATATELVGSGIKHCFSVLGKSACVREFDKHKVSFRNIDLALI